VLVDAKAHLRTSLMYDIYLIASHAEREGRISAVCSEVQMRINVQGAHPGCLHMLRLPDRLALSQAMWFEDLTPVAFRLAAIYHSCVCLYLEDRLLGTSVVSDDWDEKERLVPSQEWIICLLEGTGKIYVRRSPTPKGAVLSYSTLADIKLEPLPVVSASTSFPTR
jgi:hypothetical protein